jgi:hypothetical protein
MKVLLPPMLNEMAAFMPWLPPAETSTGGYVVETYTAGCNNFEAKAQDTILAMLQDKQLLATIAAQDSENSGTTALQMWKPPQGVGLSLWALPFASSNGSPAHISRNAVIVIQNGWRGCLARRQLVVLRRQRAIREALEETEPSFMAEREGAGGKKEKKKTRPPLIQHLWNTYLPLVDCSDQRCNACNVTFADFDPRISSDEHVKVKHAVQHKNNTTEGTRYVMSLAKLIARLTDVQETLQAHMEEWSGQSNNLFFEGSDFSERVSP